jgi:RNA polymerase sigma factor (sigma-70 family)
VIHSGTQRSGSSKPRAAISGSCVRIPAGHQSGRSRSPESAPPGSLAHREAYDPPRTERERDALYADIQPLVRRLVDQYSREPRLRRKLEEQAYDRFCQLVDAYDPGQLVPIRTYLVRTLPAAVLSSARGRLRRDDPESDAEGDAGRHDGHHYLQLTDAGDDGAAMRSVLDALPQAIAVLPLRQRQVVIHRYYEARTLDEIAAASGIRITAVRALLRQGLRNLQRQVNATITVTTSEEVCATTDSDNTHRR